MSAYDASNNEIFNTIHSELLNILFNNRQQTPSRNTARRSRNHPVYSHREPHRQNPYNYVYAMWRQYNSNIEQYQRIMETNILPYVENENEFYNISTTYNHNMYNYQLNFNGVMGNLFNNNYIYNPSFIGSRNATVYADPVATPTATYTPTATANQPANNDDQPGIYYRRNRPATPVPRYEYIIHSTFDLDLPEIHNNNNNRSLTNITNEQILNATQMVAYDLSMNTTCPISYMEFEEGDLVCQIKQCKHVFKPYFIMNWLENYSAHCPVCRYDLRTYIPDNMENNIV